MTLLSKLPVLFNRFYSLKRRSFIIKLSVNYSKTLFKKSTSFRSTLGMSKSNSDTSMLELISRCIQKLRSLSLKKKKSKLVFNPHVNFENSTRLFQRRIWGLNSRAVQANGFRTNPLRVTIVMLSRSGSWPSVCIYTHLSRARTRRISG